MATANSKYRIIIGQNTYSFDEDSIRELFAEGVVDERSQVFDPSLNQLTHLANLFDLMGWEKPAPPKPDPLNESVDLYQPIRESLWAAAGLFSVEVLGTLLLLVIIIALITGGRGVILIFNQYLWLAALIIGGGLSTLRLRRRMQKRLGRKLTSNDELSSISSWIEAYSTEEKAKGKDKVKDEAEVVQPDSNPVETKKSEDAKSGRRPEK